MLLSVWGWAWAQETHESKVAPNQPLTMHGDHQHHSMQRADDAATEPMDVGVDERLGQTIDLDMQFLDEKGQALRLGDHVDQPTLLLPVYFYCPQACSMMLGSLAANLNKIPLTPGKDFKVAAISFDPEETPEEAHQAKRNYFRILGESFGQENWRFLTGRQDQIEALTASLGYRFHKTGPHMFVHPNVLIVISPSGKIIRYLYGLNFLPFDMGMALSEALQGTPKTSVRRLLTYCFDYDPQNKRYVFKTFRIMAAAILGAMVLLLFFLLRKGKKPRQRVGRGAPGNQS